MCGRTMCMCRSELQATCPQQRSHNISREIVRDLLLREFPALKKKYRSSHLWGRGYFCCTVGAVTEEMVKRYIEDQGDHPQGFKVWDETPTDSSAQPAFRPISKPSSSDEGR